MATHMLKYHVGVPLAIFGLLIAVGLPAGTAIFVGAMAGCMSMMVMMMGRQHSDDRESKSDAVSGRPDVPRDSSRRSSR